MRCRTILFALPALLYALGLGGCSPDEYVQVAVPREVRAVTGAPERVPLAAFAEVRAEYEAAVKAKAEAAADDAARAARALAKVTRATVTRFAGELDRVRAEQAAALEALGDEAEAREQDLARATAALESAARAARDRMEALERKGREKADAITAAVTGGLSMASDSPLAQVPGIGYLLAGATGLAGLFIRRPGSAAAQERAVREAADRAYDEGRRAVRDEIMLAGRMPTLAPVAAAPQTGAGA